MKPVIRYQSLLPARRSYKPTRTSRYRPLTKLTLVFRPDRPVSIRLTTPDG